MGNSFRLILFNFFNNLHIFHTQKLDYLFTAESLTFKRTKINCVLKHNYKIINYIKNCRFNAVRTFTHKIMLKTFMHISYCQIQIKSKIIQKEKAFKLMFMIKPLFKTFTNISINNFHIFSCHYQHYKSLLPHSKKMFMNHFLLVYQMCCLVHKLH